LTGFVSAEMKQTLIGTENACGVDSSAYTFWKYLNE
jgi:hypothetical protein